MRKQKGNIRKGFIVMLIFLILFLPFGQVGLTEASERKFENELDISVEGTPTQEQVILNVVTDYSDLNNLELVLPKGIEYDEESTKELNSNSEITYHYEENRLNIPKEKGSPISENIILTGFNVGDNILQVRGQFEDGGTEIVEFKVSVESDSSSGNEDLEELDTEAEVEEFEKTIRINQSQIT